MMQPSCTNLTDLRPNGVCSSFDNDASRCVLHTIGRTPCRYEQGRCRRDERRCRRSDVLIPSRRVIVAGSATPDHTVSELHVRFNGSRILRADLRGPPLHSVAAEEPATLEEPRAVCMRRSSASRGNGRDVYTPRQWLSCCRPDGGCNRSSSAGDVGSHLPFNWIDAVPCLSNFSSWHRLEHTAFLLEDSMQLGHMQMSFAALFSHVSSLPRGSTLIASFEIGGSSAGEFPSPKGWRHAFRRYYLPLLASIRLRAHALGVRVVILGSLDPTLCNYERAWRATWTPAAGSGSRGPRAARVSLD